MLTRRLAPDPVMRPNTNPEEEIWVRIAPSCRFRGLSSDLSQFSQPCTRQCSPAAERFAGVRVDLPRTGPLIPACLSEHRLGLRVILSTGCERGARNWHSESAT